MTSDYQAPYPHCDSRVLHAPGECVFCDHYPDEQAARVANGINFTGHGPDPASAFRPVERINRWGGNRPMTQADLDAEDREWEKFYQNLKDEGLLPREWKLEEYGPERYSAADKAKQAIRKGFGSLVAKIRR